MNTLLITADKYSELCNNAIQACTQSRDHGLINANLELFRDHLRTVSKQLKLQHAPEMADYVADLKKKHKILCDTIVELEDILREDEAGEGPVCMERIQMLVSDLVRVSKAEAVAILLNSRGEVTWTDVLQAQKRVKAANGALNRELEKAFA